MKFSYFRKNILRNKLIPFRNPNSMSFLNFISFHLGVNSYSQHIELKASDIQEDLILIQKVRSLFDIFLMERLPLFIIDVTEWKQEGIH